jgi:hypothetical protein
MRILIHNTVLHCRYMLITCTVLYMKVDMASLKARLGHVEAERAQLAARLEDTRLGAEADLQRLSSTLCEEVSVLNLQQVSADHRVLTYVEYRTVSDVFQNIDPPPPSPPSECVLPPHQRRGVHTRRAVRGAGDQYFGRRQP